MNPFEGKIYGGVGFVIAAYTVVWGGLLLYAVYLVIRRRAARIEAEKSQ